MDKDLKKKMVKESKYDCKTGEVYMVFDDDTYTVTNISTILTNESQDIYKFLCEILDSFEWTFINSPLDPDKVVGPKNLPTYMFWQFCAANETHQEHVGLSLYRFFAAIAGIVHNDYLISADDVKSVEYLFKAELPTLTDVIKNKVVEVIALNITEWNMAQDVYCLINEEQAVKVTKKYNV